MNLSLIFQSERMLKEEKDSDDQLKEQFKERWTRIPSARLTEQFTVNAQKYREIINNAVAADKVCSSSALIYLLTVSLLFTHSGFILLTHSIL